MPELPEVETVRRSLNAVLPRLRIVDVDVLYDKAIQTLTPDEFRMKIEGETVRTVDRRGKYLIVVFASKARLAYHLRMTGQLIVCRSGGKSPTRHSRLIVHYNQGVSVRFDDQRKFGRVTWFSDEDSMHRAIRLGPEPIDEHFHAVDLAELLAGRRRPIKSLLLDQRIIAGLGNIYADEALHRAAIAPHTPSGSLTAGQVDALWAACRTVLWEGIAAEGTTLRDFVDAEGQIGGYQTSLKVYGRAGKPCFTCGTMIRRVVLSGRSSSFCPTCQA